MLVLLVEQVVMVLVFLMGIRVFLVVKVVVEVILVWDQKVRVQERAVQVLVVLLVVEEEDVMVEKVMIPAVVVVYMLGEEQEALMSLIQLQMYHI